MTRKRNIKRFAALIALCLFAATVLSPIGALAATVDEIYSSVTADLSSRDNARYCFDMANILSESTENDIAVKGRQLYEAGKGQIQIVTVDNLSGADQAQFATTLFNKEGLGGKQSDNGLLILMIKEGTHCQIVTGDGIAGTLTDGRCGRILDTYMMPQMDDEEYDKAATDTYDACYTYLDGGEIEAVEEDSDGGFLYKAMFVIIGLWVLIWPLSLLLVIFDRLFALCAYPVRRTWAYTPLMKAASTLATVGLVPLKVIFSGNGRGGGYGGGYSGGGGGFSSGGGGSSSGGGAGR